MGLSKSVRGLERQKEWRAQFEAGMEALCELRLKEAQEILGALGRQDDDEHAESKRFVADAFAQVIVGELMEAAYYFRVSWTLNGEQDGLLLAARVSRVIAPTSNFNRISSVIENYRAAMTIIDRGGPKPNRIARLTQATLSTMKSVVKSTFQPPRVPSRDPDKHPFKAGLHALCELQFGLAEKLLSESLAGDSETADARFPTYIALALNSTASGNYEQGRRYLSMALKCRKSARARLLSSRLAQLPAPTVVLDGRPLSSLTPDERWEKYKCLWREMDQFSALAEAGSLRDYVPKREGPRMGYRD